MSDDGCGFPAPGLHSFLFKPMFTVGGFEFNKVMLLALLTTLVVVSFFYIAFGKAKMVPGKLQMMGEAGYDFVRRGIVYETMGKKDGEKYVPLMVSLFFFIWIMNIWSVIPLTQFPVSSIIAYPAVLAAVVYLVWVPLTFKTHGLAGRTSPDSTTRSARSSGSCRSSSSSRTSSCAPSRTRCDSSPTCSPVT
jgi:F-type H+-transporting ATPase subunit a